MNEYSTHTDAQRGELDMTHLATIGGAAYYELRQIVRQVDGIRTVVGLASAWPVIERDARIAELEALLDAVQQQAAESEQHCAELIARVQAAERVPPAVAAAASGMPLQTAPLPGASAAAAETPPTHPCSDCDRTFGSARALSTHRTRVHRTKDAPRTESDAPPPVVTTVAIVPIPVPPPFACAACGKSEFAQSIAEPTLCIRCQAARAAERPNGHAHAVGHV